VLVRVRDRCLLAGAEFLDLWHSLKVPNDVDLLRQLESGASPPFVVTWPQFCVSSSSHAARGFTGDRGRSDYGQDADGQEEGQEICAAESPSKDYEPTLEGYGYRPVEGLYSSWKLSADGHWTHYDMLTRTRALFYLAFVCYITWTSSI
jgi:hypothetical protein